MFNYICPRCGATVDVADDECPHCAAQESIDADETAEIAALGSPSRPAGAGLERGTGSLSERSGPSRPTRATPSADEAPRRRGVQLQAWHYITFGGVLVAAILGAVLLSGGMSALRFEAPEEAEMPPVETFAIGVLGPIEVSGIRPYYDDEYQTHVRAFVANHSKQEQSVAFAVLLRVREASQQAPPLATFEVVISDPLPPNAGKEVDVRLRAMGSLQSLPRWNEMRVDLEVLSARGG